MACAVVKASSASTLALALASASALRLLSLRRRFCGLSSVRVLLTVPRTWG